jgi:hypothetical protein
MAGGRRAGQKESRLFRLGQPWTFSVWLRHVKELVLDGLPFQVNENCIYISAGRQISDSHQPLVP